MIRLRPAYAAVLLFACSPVNDPSAFPDASIDAPDNGPLMIVSSSPDNMSQQNSVISPISLYFNHKLDESTVNATTVKLRYSYGYGWVYGYATISYDDAANHKISIVPPQPLYTNNRYEVLVNGVKDLQGNTMTDGAVKFVTKTNSVTRATYLNTSGAINAWYRYELDMNGRMTKGIYSNGWGPDMTWFTTDDMTACCPYGYLYLPDGRQSEQRSWGSAGPDGKFGTADDVLTNIYKYTYNSTTGQLDDYTYYGPGPDGLLGNADDVVTGYSVYKYDANGFNTEQASYSSPGADAIWKTADDLGYSWNQYTVDDKGNKTKYIYRDNGPDQKPHTTDDLVVQINETMYDSYGYYTRQVGKDTAGPDGVWDTADDHIYYYMKTDRDANGLPIQQSQYQSPGPNGIWFDADDQLVYYQKTMFNSLKLPVEYDSFGPGPDGILGNADDVLTGYSTNVYETNGNVIERKGFSPGPDGMYKTADDRYTYRGDYDPTR